MALCLMNSLKPSGYNVYHLLYHTKILHPAHTMYIHEFGVRDLWTGYGLDLLTTCIHHMELHFTDH
jgi:hypothetical protein